MKASIYLNESYKKENGESMIYGSVHKFVSLGYNDISSFYRAFKRWTRTTPNEYKNTIKDNEPIDANL